MRFLALKSAKKTSDIILTMIDAGQEYRRRPATDLYLSTRIMVRSVELHQFTALLFLQIHENLCHPSMIWI